MSGRVVAHQTVTFAKKGKQKVTFSLDAAAWNKLAFGGSALISFETPNDEVQALFVPDFEK